mmetsp:Transcript_95494/g.247298  ORF Transcript_95494/g.247298 Transcript_95494/m.247298 type:complete len:279 (-) Transcript_95494:26-862(-)
MPVCGLPHSTPCRRHAARRCLHSCSADAGERLGGEPLHGAAQLPANLLCGLGCALLIIVVEPILPSPQSFDASLVCHLRVLCPHQALLANQSLLELLPVHPPYGLVADGTLFPLRFQGVPLVAQHRVELVIGQGQFGTTRNRSSRGKFSEHGGGRLTQLICQSSAGCVLHSLPSGPDVQNPSIVRCCCQLPEQLHPRETTEGLPSDGLRVGKASRRHLMPKALDGRAEVPRLRGRWQRGAAPVLEKVEQPSASLARRLALLAGLHRGMQCLLQIVVCG